MDQLARWINDDPSGKGASSDSIGWGIAIAIVLMIVIVVSGAIAKKWPK